MASEKHLSERRRFAPAQPADRTAALKDVAVKTLTTCAPAREPVPGENTVAPCPGTGVRQSSTRPNSCNKRAWCAGFCLLVARWLYERTPARAPMQFGDRAASMTPTAKRRQ